MATDRTLSWVDYAVFAASLSLSIGTGVYHAIRSRFLLRSGLAKSSAKDEYLMGGHNMPSIPVALSLLTTFLSGILMLAVPAEMFQRGAQIWLNFVIGAASSVITCLVFLPVFHKMKCTCLHEYFIHRYNSPLIRKLFSFMFLLFTIIYMSIVIYAPAVALSPVLQIHKWWLVLIFGLSTTLYTCIGGLKAVVWSDSLQAVLMYSGVFTLIVQGLRHPRVGGLERVWSIAVESGRTAELFRHDPRIDQYNSIWINLFSGTITWLASFGVNQLAIQRYASLPSLHKAQNIIYCTLIPFIILCSIVAFVGFITLAYFYNCNPVETGEIADTDHITILFARDILQPTPGLFGLYVSCIMSATLSTLSSGMNSMAAAIYEDFLKQKLDGKITDHQATFLNKTIVVLCGITSTALAFAAEPLGGILRVCVSVMGALSGPMVAIFVLAMFFPRSGFWSCIISFVASNIIMVIICIANYIEDPYRDLFLPTNSSSAGCGSRNLTIRQPPLYDAHYGDPSTMFMSRISTYGYAGVGFVLMMAIGIAINIFKPEQKPERIRHLTFAGRKEPWPETYRELDHFIQADKAT
nr:Sodium solute symporter domain containing protein [Haemonchus contortus]